MNGLSASLGSSTEAGSDAQMSAHVDGVLDSLATGVVGLC